MNDLAHLAWVAAIALAVAGGGVSIMGYRKRKLELQSHESGRLTAHMLYMISYILMSLSIFLIALRGLLA